MRKSEIVDCVAAEASLTRRAANSAVDAVLAAIGKAVARGETVTVAGFGRFSRKTRAAREGRNPHTGERLVIGASNTVSFKAGKTLKERLN